MVCVRVTNMRGVDLSVYHFNYDLTFVSLVMRADGHIYCTYGDRNAHSPDAHLSMETLAAALKAAKALHDASPIADRSKPLKRDPKTHVESLSSYAKTFAPKKRNECVHCHTVNDLQRTHFEAKGTWKRIDNFKWPDLAQLGLEMSTRDSLEVTRVSPKSIASRAGVKIGDRLVKVGEREPQSYGDLKRALDELPKRTGTATIAVNRSGTTKTLTARLNKNWRIPNAATFAWRGMKWRMVPQPGFGGRPLSVVQKRKQGIDTKNFAFRVGYIVNWGPRAHVGRAVAVAGLRKHDVVVAVDGKQDFGSVSEFHAWVRLNKKVGETLRVDVLRKGQPKTFRIPMVK